MTEFPEFMRNPINRIKQSSQYTKDIEGYVYEGKDGSQIAYWTCFEDRNSSEHFHDFDEYLVCVYGQYNVNISGNIIKLRPGNELHIQGGVPHSGSCTAGTRTIHVFGGKRAERESD
ncbi:MAG: cupin [Spirochaetia bacterium]|nr:cupin [Spirochaetia bacterium]